ncbi:6700_t:CDS:2 [Funneliformis geosporum]|uniref:19880_t:CDS:1 n=1 Tax=Funneliformis geosporum TaxID=1117311 RepID=A0A9W4WW82_9GLOM|nr:6700_t:CDS:2 [Funneliformis geosporum]CAI2190394.1 19880_t:CDS:2 [Funneliformis geosporum]
MENKDKLLDEKPLTIDKKNFPDLKSGMVNFVQSTDENLHCIASYLTQVESFFSYTNCIKNLERYIKQHYFYPIRLQDELTNLYKAHSCLKRIRACISDNHFLIEKYNEGTQSIQLFNLATMECKEKFWDSAAENNIRTYDSDECLNFKIVSYNARCPGNLLTINADVQEQDQYDCNLIPSGENITLNEDQCHRIYHRNRNNTSLKPLVSNKKPWVDEFDYERISAYLDDEETIQLIIGRTTVQVWRENKEVPIHGQIKQN